MRHKITLALLGVVCLAVPAHAQSPSPNPWNMVGVFHTFGKYQPPQYFVAGQISGNDTGWWGYEVDLKHQEAEATNNEEENVSGFLIVGTPTSDSIICERQDNVQSGVTVDGKPQKGSGTLTQPEGTALYSCADYSDPAGAPTPVFWQGGNCSTTAGIWAEVRAQGSAYTVGEFCANMSGTDGVVVAPDAPGVTHYDVIHAFNNYGSNDCCHTNLCIAGSGCTPPPSGASCQRLCNPAGY